MSTPRAEFGLYFFFLLLLQLARHFFLPFLLGAPTSNWIRGKKRKKKMLAGVTHNMSLEIKPPWGDVYKVQPDMGKKALKNAQ